MAAFYDLKPSKLEAVGNGAFLYRWNIKEVTVQAAAQTLEGADEDTEPSERQQRTQWEADEVTVWPPVTSNKITEAVITSKWEPNYEQKLVNEYNAAQLGLYGATTSDEATARIAAYTDYLTERAAAKAQVDADCAELGIE